VTIDDALDQIQARLVLEAEAEHEVLEEIRGHLEEAVAAGKARGLDEQKALAEAARAFGIEETAAALRETHAGWGTLEGVAAAALPVLLALVFRWLIFAPEGTADAWRESLSRPTLTVIAAVAMLLPLALFARRGYAIALWIFFWGLSVITLIWPAWRW
jgi:hypothetical protein